MTNQGIPIEKQGKDERTTEKFEFPSLLYSEQGNLDRENLKYYYEF